MLISALSSCKNENKSKEDAVEIVVETQYKSFGKSIIPDDSISVKSMASGDSINTKMIAKVEKVCQAKGCWMKVGLGNNERHVCI